MAQVTAPNLKRDLHSRFAEMKEIFDEPLADPKGLHVWVGTTGRRWGTSGDGDLGLGAEEPRELKDALA